MTVQKLRRVILQCKRLISHSTGIKPEGTYHVTNDTTIQQLRHKCESQ